MPAVMATFSIHASNGGCSRGAPVVVVEPAEHGSSNDAAFESADAWSGLLPTKRLMRARLIIKAHVLRQQTPQVLMTKDHHVVEQLPAEGPGESLSERVHREYDRGKIEARVVHRCDRGPRPIDVTAR
jgi:hypothetical protein